MDAITIATLITTGLTFLINIHQSYKHGLFKIDSECGCCKLHYEAEDSN